MPPTALAGLFAAKVVEQPNYMKVLKHCLAPAGFTILASLAFIATAGFWDRFLFWDNRLGVYGIPLIVLLLIGWHILRERRLTDQMEAALVLIPLILRLLMIK